MKILITGGCGFLGSNLALEAIKLGYELVVFDNLSRLGASENLTWLHNQGKFQYFHGDIRNTNDVNKLIKNVKPNIIFHLAGQVAMTTSIVDPRLDFEVNVYGSLNLLEAVRQFSAEAIIVYSSTNKVYGDLEQYEYTENNNRYECVEYPNGFDEYCPLEFHSPYGCSKGAADQYMLDYARIFGLNTVVFRHSSMYGGRQFSTFDQGWIGWFCQKAIESRKDLQDERFTISGTGKQVRDVLHADDMISVYYSVIEHIENVRGNAFNIGGGINNSLSLLELFKLLEDVTGIKLNYTKIAPRISDQKVFVSDINKACTKLNWLPTITAQEGVERMLSWVESNC